MDLEHANVWKDKKGLLGRSFPSQVSVNVCIETLAEECSEIGSIHCCFYICFFTSPHYHFWLCILLSSFYTYLAFLQGPVPSHVIYTDWLVKYCIYSRNFSHFFGKFSRQKTGANIMRGIFGMCCFRGDFQVRS
jgi:hypothetical protein